MDFNPFSRTNTRWITVAILVLFALPLLGITLGTELMNMSLGILTLGSLLRLYAIWSIIGLVRRDF